MLVTESFVVRLGQERSGQCNGKAAFKAQGKGWTFRQAGQPWVRVCPLTSCPTVNVRSFIACAVRVPEVIRRNTELPDCRAPEGAHGFVCQADKQTESTCNVVCEKHPHRGKLGFCGSYTHTQTTREGRGPRRGGRQGMKRELEVLLTSMKLHLELQE